jgi:hypothetical protein
MTSNMQKTFCYRSIGPGHHCKSLRCFLPACLAPHMSLRAASRLQHLAETITMSSASDPSPIFTTPELVEQILLNLDMRTLLVSAQRVSKTWHDLIASSRPLQRALYFEPIAAATFKELTTTRTRNPLLEEIFPPFFPGKESTLTNPIYMLDGRGGRAHPGFDFMAADPNPPNLDEPQTPKYTGKDSIPVVRAAAEQRKEARSAAEARKKDVAVRRRAAFLRKGASWRRMLVQQPAATRIGWIENRGMTEQSYYQGMLSAPLSKVCKAPARSRISSWLSGSGAQEVGGGVRMGLLYDAVYQYTGGPRAAFNVYWRDPAKDPPMPEYFGHGSGEVVLAQFSDDVGIVINMNAAGMDVRHVPEIRRVADVRDRSYMPEEFEVREVALRFVFGQDWFG